MRIIKLIQSAEKPFFSLEFFPPADINKLDAFFETADTLKKLNPLFVSVTYGAGGSKQRNTLKITAELVKRGFTTMAHLTCISSKPDEILDFLHSLVSHGVNNVLALRGDRPLDGDWDENGAYFKHAKDLVTFIRSIMPQMGVAVAAYPSPHPESPTFDSDRLYTIEKLVAGADFAITQLFFDNREYMAIVSDLHRRNIDVPIIPGIMPIQSFEGLKKVLSLCGATIPAKFYLELEEANVKGGVEAVREAGIKFALKQIRRLLDFGAPGVHLYTLNKSDLCKRLITESGL